ncbi:hypothetical protein LITTLEE_207 [Mycobacterium phage LittleE]|uniref:Uncharacterized protein n=2 Tax=Omegavirus TaxID=1623292 RepID=G1D491_9CAUD|nr:hypothetical protein N860_gp210 [Mycobacterium phage Redno2]YP_009205341.1 hypothetical protein AVT17_gp219 [Mycobacterium phage Ariel]YP_009637117.1 hypothetical protein FGG27_gp213 [Mycobacterium phage LittleE]ATS93044.1 hypothetical protein SEA_SUPERPHIKIMAN_206 [Mycobacterium phage Superphikiman]AXQ62604.1 hypothetical protein SEA_ZELINK_199 [Mycobacterium phage Zelink]QBJ00152.1 hypothetical protein SEA_PHOEBUS_207 [Mycobacterium phage Phoebus]QDM55784.1 hypothetical protein SEA_HOKKE
MGAMKALATELQHWEPWDQPEALHEYWTRYLPDGELAVLGSDNYGRTHLWVGEDYRGEFPTLMLALRAVGEIAKGQLEYEMRTWVA